MEQFLDALSKMDINRGIAILAVVGFGIFVMVKVFGHMKDGFGPFNVRITGLVLVATLASILAVMNPSGESAAIGILGAIAGYLFGYGGKD
jgi:predicted MFS family arabinose efflux permease